MAYDGNNAIVSGFDSEKDDGLKIVLERCPSDRDCLKVHLGNRLDNYNAGYFQRSVERIMLAGYRHLLFCCAGLSYVSSTGIGAFTNILKDLRFAGGDMILSQVQGRVYEVFELLRFTTFFTFAGDETGAPSDSSRPGRASSFRPPVFPLAFRCPSCSARLKTTKSGKFLCSTCRTRIVVDSRGRVRTWREVS